MAKRMTPVFAVGALLLLLVAVGPVEASFPGTNGKIAYDSGGLRDTEVWSIDADGTARANLTRNDNKTDTAAAWSPDGERIAFVSDTPNGESNLFVMNADGSGLTRLTETAGFGEAEPSWSPDGTRIAFTRTEDLYNETDDYYYTAHNIYAINADGTGEVRLADGSEDNYDPAWSPDGSRIAFASSRGTTPRTAGGEIYVTEAAPEGPSNEPVRLTATRSGNYSPDWSPDGTKIAFESGRDRPRSHDFVGEIYTMNADGTEQTRLTRQGNYNAPDWSPDGKRLAFSRGGIYTMKAVPLDDKNRPRPVITSKHGDQRNPDWQAIP